MAVKLKQLADRSGAKGRKVRLQGSASVMTGVRAIVGIPFRVQHRLPADPLRERVPDFKPIEINGLSIPFFLARNRLRHPWQKPRCVPLLASRDGGIMNKTSGPLGAAGREGRMSATILNLIIQ